MFQSLIRHSAHQHARLGVKSSHFVAFGEALIWSLQQQFGPAFTPEVREAWTALYASVKNEMMGVQR
jgi:hemoglobin-like flavoprotein